MIDYSKKTFRNIQIDTSEIKPSVLNIEDKKRSNMFNWNGQFSPQFVEAILDKYAMKDAIIYDPFVGSGTTLHESARKNIEAYGTELNQSAYYMAKIYEFANIDIEKRANIIKEIDNILNNISEDGNILDTITNEINNSNEHIKNILSLLIILMDIQKNKVSSKLLDEKWNDIKKIISNTPYSSEIIEVYNGDSRYSKVKDNSIDLVFTSPPYINVFNYHQNYRKSVELLGYDVLKTARKEVGSNRKNRGNRFLTVIQYTLDIALTIQDMIRVGKNDARFILVVGRESNVLKISFTNSEIIYNIGREIFGLNFLLKQERVFKNRFGKMIYEDILHFKNNKLNQHLTEEVIIKKARLIARRMLVERVKQINENYKDYDLLISAINKADQVNKSEV